MRRRRAANPTWWLLAGCNGPMAARIALLRAQKQLYEDADVHINLRNFAVRAVVPGVLARALLSEVGCRTYPALTR